jgi:hypothetical protein
MCVFCSFIVLVLEVVYLGVVLLDSLLNPAYAPLNSFLREN